MIVGLELDWRQMLRSAGPLLAGLFAYDLIVAIAYTYLNVRWLAIDGLPVPLLGTAIGVFLALRNNVAYARWWEARTLWGAIVNASRSLVRATLAMVPDPDVRQQVAYLQIAYVIALRCGLRRLDPWPEITPLLPEETAARLRGSANLATQLLAEQARLLSVQNDEDGDSRMIRLGTFDRTLSDLSNAQGGLERIRNTPLPRHFDHFPRLVITAYGLLLPLGLVAGLEMLTPLGSTLISAVFFALDRIGVDLETPLDNTVHDVPMTAITRTIEIDLRQMLGETAVPKPVTPVNGVLW